jgi:hypothetical protein
LEKILAQLYIFPLRKQLSPKGGSFIVCLKQRYAGERGAAVPPSPEGLGFPAVKRMKLVIPVNAYLSGLIATSAFFGMYLICLGIEKWDIQKTSARKSPLIVS